MDAAAARECITRLLSSSIGGGAPPSSHHERAGMGVRAGPRVSCRLPPWMPACPPPPSSPQKGKPSPPHSRMTRRTKCEAGRAFKANRSYPRDRARAGRLPAPCKPAALRERHVAERRNAFRRQIARIPDWWCDARAAAGDGGIPRDDRPASSSPPCQQQLQQSVAGPIVVIRSGDKRRHARAQTQGARLLERERRGGRRPLHLHRRP